MDPEWLARLVGTPFIEKGRTRAGCDCWGLVRLALADGFGVLVPDYSEDYATTTDREEIQALMRREAPDWAELPAAQARPGDVVLFRIQGHVCHAGVVVAAGLFLHCQRRIGAVLERLDSPLWTQRRVSILRHAALQEAAC